MRYGDGDVGTPQSPERSNDNSEGAHGRYLDDDVDQVPTAPPDNAKMEAPSAANAPTMLEIDRVRALLEDVDLDERYYVRHSG